MVGWERDARAVAEVRGAVAQEVEEGEGDAQGGEIVEEALSVLLDVVVDGRLNDDGVGGGGDVEARVGVAEDGVLGWDDGARVWAVADEDGFGGVYVAGDDIGVDSGDGVGLTGVAWSLAIVRKDGGKGLGGEKERD